jgi:hypothetical protein
MDREVLHKEIDLIQGVINRMASNSFMLKGWLISLIAVVLALSKDSLFSCNAIFVCSILCFPILIFWYLDAFFLHREKCYRALYEWVIKNRMSTNENLYSLNYRPYQKKVNSQLKIMFSKTLFPIYGLSFILLIIVILFIK